MNFNLPLKESESSHSQVNSHFKTIGNFPSLSYYQCSSQDISNLSVGSKATLTDNYGLPLLPASSTLQSQTDTHAPTVHPSQQTNMSCQNINNELDFNYDYIAYY